MLIYMSIKKINISLASAAGNKARSHAHEVNSKGSASYRCDSDLFVPLNLKDLAQ